MDGQPASYSTSLPGKLIRRLKTFRQTRPRLCFLLTVLLTEMLVMGMLDYYPDDQDRKPRTPEEILDAGYGDARTIEALGSNAIPFLLKAIAQKPSNFGQLMDKNIVKYGNKLNLPETLLNALPSANRIESRRLKAVFTLASADSRTEAAIPALIRIFGDQTENAEMKSAAHNALLAKGEKLASFTPEFIQSLNDPNRSMQLMAVDLLSAIGPKAQAAVPALLQATTNQDTALSTAAVCALWKIDRQTNLALRVFTNALQAPDLWTRQQAVKNLGEMGLAAKSIAPLLQPFLLHPDSNLRLQTEKTLRELDPSLLRSTLDELNANPAPIVQKIIQIISTGTLRDQLSALEALRLFGPNAVPAIPALIQFLSRPVATNFTQTVNGFTPSRGQGRARVEAAQVLAEIGPAASPAVPALVNLLQKSPRTSWRTMLSACQALGQIGPTAASAVPALEKLRDSDVTDDNRSPESKIYLKFAATDALTRIVPSSGNNYIAALTNYAAYYDIQLPAQVALWRLGEKTNPPVERLAGYLNSPSPDRDAIDLLGEIGPPAKPALPVLKKLLDYNQTLTTRRSAAIAIRKIDPAEAANLGLPGLLAIP